MFSRVGQSVGIVSRYVAFNALLVVSGILVVDQVVKMSAGLISATQLPPASQDVSGGDVTRVEKFKQAEAAAAMAPQVPVPRLIYAQDMPEVPVQVLAVRLDQAESLKIQPLRLKRKLSGQTKVKAKKAPLQMAGSSATPNKIPPAIADIADSELSHRPRVKKKGAVLAETSRDITNRSLGVLVAMKY